MLPKKERLSRAEFNRFFSIGKRINSPSFQIVYVKNVLLHASVVVPKKVAKSAVVRNKIRRRIYDIVRHYRSDKGMNGVFIFLVKPGAKLQSYVSLKEEVCTQLNAIIKKTN